MFIAALRKLGPLVLGRITVQGLLAFVFLSAGLDKLLVSGPGLTGATLANLGFGSPTGTTLMAVLVGAAEVGLGLWLASGRLPNLSAAVSAGVIVVFSGALVVVGCRLGWTQSCGCCGLFLGLATVQLGLVRNALMFGAALFLLVPRTWWATSAPGLGGAPAQPRTL
ncbi:MAG: DoxX family membrane protein [Phycisphaerae bacterium]|nr:DoxX family membrane protein [Phycisphaerae bacterium]MCZ2399858.1 DoxX family membrane protein [Phycisphaerae bacterium]NUQ48491.1 DoxX family membrane protein [Phycisphaerae bacterium]